MGVERAVGVVIVAKESTHPQGWFLYAVLWSCDDTMTPSGVQVVLPRLFALVVLLPWL